MSIIENNLHQVHARILDAAQQCGRDPQDITLLAVSKTKPVAAIAEAIAAGQRAFGENYVQEGVEKVRYFQSSNDVPDLEWHFIGPLQSNKSRLVAEHFDWCHTLDRVALARRLNDQRPPQLAPLNVLIQVNISAEASKSGIAPGEVMALAALLADLPHLRLRGLMAIPAPAADLAAQRAVFDRMAALLNQLRQHYPALDTLSMGMSDDMPAAIAAGSTLVRIGTAIFGARDYPPVTGH